MLTCTHVILGVDVKKIVMLLVLTSLSLSYAGLFSGSEDAKFGIAVVDLGRIMETSTVSKEAHETLAAEFDPRRAEIVETSNAFKQEYEDFNRDKSLMTDEEVQAKQELLASKSADLTATQMSFEQEFYDAQNTLFQKLLDQVKQSVNRIAKSEGYSLVLPANQVVHYEKTHDITDKVLPTLTSVVSSADAEE
ncbi:MAG: hypothetical protein CMF46_05560 [Legionellales bacterium]|nr:hypothetical protein [Legionellales bacterium]|tara:strand:+ start:1412 stop:1990 length:579 start_codon:yes stop_codon:yes gene_type:complete